jgi:hypothetical protein
MSCEKRFADAISRQLASVQDRYEKEKREEDSAKKRFHATCEKAQEVRDAVIIPLFQEVKCAIEGKALTETCRRLDWSEVQPGGSIDVFSAKLESRECAPPISRFMIEGSVAAKSDAKGLVLSVTFRQTNPRLATAKKTRDLYPQDNTKDVCADILDLDCIRISARTGAIRGRKAAYLGKPMLQAGRRACWKQTLWSITIYQASRRHDPLADQILIASYEGFSPNNNLGPSSSGNQSGGCFLPPIL